MTQPGRKILINCLSARSGGAISYLRNAVSRIVATAHRRDRVSMVALCDADQAEMLDVAPDQILRAPTGTMSGAARVFWEKRNLSRLVRQHGFSTVFTPYQVQSARFPAKSVLMVRNMEPFYFHRYRYSPATRLRNSMLRWSTIRSTRRADHVIAVSDFARNEVIERAGLPQRRVTRIWHGRDPFFSEPVDDRCLACHLDRLGIRRPFVLTCGSLLPYRRCEDVIRAFQLYRETGHSDLQLVIAGDGNDPRYKALVHRMVRESGLESSISLAGHVNRDAMRVLYQAAEMVILATEVEACPNIAIEAMSAGAAILASDSPPLQEIIGLDNAWFFRQRDCSGLADHIRRLRESSAGSATLRDRARQRADCFSWQDCAEATTQLLEQIAVDG